MYNLGSTVAAISTPPGKGGVALIRISGDEAFAIADRCFTPRYGDTPLSGRAPRTAVRGDIHRAGEVVDDGMAFLFPAPKSYTGEDTVEITCHGGVLVTRMVLEAVFEAGALPAGPGEFTRRAFLNGGLSLTDAEAIGNLLDASTEGQVRLAGRRSRDKLSLAISELHGETVTLLASLYANIDYPEEDLAELTDGELIARLTVLGDKMDALLRTYRTGRAVAEGIRTVICGKPNVGKSSLYNLLCREDAAIVTDVAGTTRDVLERTVSTGDLTLRLSDTAGIRETEDTVERIGVARSREKMDEADLILAVFDLQSGLTQEDRDLIEVLRKSHATVVALLNKSDVGHADMTEVREAFAYTLPFSAKAGDIESLTRLLTDLFTDGNIRIGEDAILAGARQYASLFRARELVQSTLGALQGGTPADVACSDLELALGALSELDGRAVSEDVVAHIFAHFCVGK